MEMERIRIYRIVTLRKLIYVISIRKQDLQERMFQIHSLNRIENGEWSESRTMGNPDMELKSSG